MVWIACVHRNEFFAKKRHRCSFKIVRHVFELLFDGNYQYTIIS